MKSNSRRNFIKKSALASSIFIVPRHVLGGNGYTAPSDKLNIAGIGVGGRGASVLKGCESENIVALCDVDFSYASKTFKRYPDAKVYKDYRVMLDKQNDIDAVVIGTPDHTHAVITMLAMGKGKHVYCEKPLAHTVYETRTITEAAKKYNVQTQMGNQGRSSDEIRDLKEWLEDGAIGDVTEIYAWTDRPRGGKPWSHFDVKEMSKETPEIPDTMDWDLWLGPVRHRPYHPDYHPSKWRAWLDFGTGAMGDMGCHILDPSFYALDLGAPIDVQATSTHWLPEVSSQTYPLASIVRMNFPERGSKPSVKLTWSDGRILPPVPKEFAKGQKFSPSGAMLIGTDGIMIHSSHGARDLTILPNEKMLAYNKPEKTITRVPMTKEGQWGHQNDWIRACKEGKTPCSSFDYGGPLTEMALLGMIAIQVKDQRLEWDSKNLRFTNNEDANKLLHIEYRKGWSL